MSKEYYHTNEVAKLYNISTKTVSRRIKLLTADAESRLIVKERNQWKIHHLALPKFKPQQKEAEFVAVSLDPVIDYTAKELQTVIEYIVERTAAPLTISYVIETKTKNGKPHLHGYVPKDQFNRFFKVLRSLVEISYDVKPVYDLIGWQDYISKETAIITLSK